MGRKAARRSGRGVSKEKLSPGHSGVAIRVALPISSKGTRVGGRGCSLRTPRSRPEVHCRAWVRDWIRAVVGMASTEAK